MPMINVEYNKVPEEDVKILSEAMREIVISETGIDDVFVYANSAKVQIQSAPIEIFIRMSASKIDDMDTLFAKIESKIKEWKMETSFAYSINLTLIPMHWKVSIGI